MTKHELASPAPLLTPAGAGPLADELVKLVTDALGRAVPEASSVAPRRRDTRQDALWDCTSVLQKCKLVAPSQPLVDHLATLPALLERTDDEGFADELRQWIDTTWGFVGRS